MIEIKKHLLQPKIVDLSKEQCQQFHQVRKLNTPLYGLHYLYSHRQKKYIGVHLPKHKVFTTTRSQYTFYSFSQPSHTLYLMPLVGECLTSIKRMPIHQNTEAELWVEKCTSMELALKEVIKVALEVHEQFGICDLQAECFRIQGGKLHYLYDSWMNDSYHIVEKSQMEIQNYYFSETDLKLMEEKKNTAFESNFKDYLFKVGLFVLSLAVPELKCRKYQYCQFKLNWTNIFQQLDRLATKYKELHLIIDKFIHKKIQTLHDLWKVVGCEDFGKKHNICASGKKWNKKECQKVHDKENQSNLSMISQTETAHKKMRLSLKPNNNHRESVFSTTEGKKHRKTMTSSVVLHNEYKLEFNIKKRLETFTPEQCVKILEYLDLNEYLPQSQYEKKVLVALEDIRVKDDWVKKVYGNGAVYFGQLDGEKRNGTGMYLFDSDDLYFGQWKNNQMEGYGHYIFKSGEMYEGQIQSGHKHGFGRFYYSDGKQYEGYWRQNEKYGLGTMLFPNGVKFFGCFKPTNQTTEGIFTRIQNNQVLQYSSTLQCYNSDKNTFHYHQKIKKTKLSQCKVETFTSIQNQDGLIYRGDCVHSIPHGYGVLEGKGEVYEGEWKEGKENGSGKVSVDGKFTIEGTFKDGFMVEYKM